MEKGTRFEQIYFMQKGLNQFIWVGSDDLTKERYQLYRQTVFDPIYIKHSTTQEKRRYQESIMIMEQSSTKKNSKEEWYSTENQLDSGFQGRILQVPRHHWGLFFNGNNWWLQGTRYHGSICSQHIHPYQNSTKERLWRNGNNENDRCASGHAIGTG